MNTNGLSLENIQLHARRELVMRMKNTIYPDGHQKIREAIYEFMPKDCRIAKTSGLHKLDEPNFNISELVEENRALFHKYEHISRFKGKDYLQQITTVQDYLPSSRTLDFATSPDILVPISSYLGMLPCLWNVTVLRSPSYEAQLVGGEQPHGYSGSQLWHRDAEDMSNIKVWILLDDVSEDDGPTVLLPADVSESIAIALDYRQGLKLPDLPVFANHRESAMNLTGPRGTVYLTDTDRCFHYGSRVSSTKTRLVLLLHYITPLSIYFWPSNLFQGGPKLDDLTQYLWDTDNEILAHLFYGRHSLALSNR